MDYRKAGHLDLEEVKKFFEKNYKVIKIWQEGRHVLGILEKDGVKLFLKLATTTGISATTQIDYNWQRETNDILSRSIDFWVPQNVDSGLYKKNLFYMISEYFEGELLARSPHPDKKIAKLLQENLNTIINCCEVLQNLNIERLSEKENENNQKYFLEKTESWYKDIPKDILLKYNVVELLQIVEKGYLNLERKARHGDFTPWHLLKLKNGKLGLIDGEHAMKNGVEYYDVSFLIQRVFAIMENPKSAKEICKEVLKRGYDLEKLKTVLAARAIGGFLDSSIFYSNVPNFTFANKFKDWVLSL